jgi:chromate transporter
MITPGPVVIAVAFIGFIVAGVPGTTAAALGIFFPVYLVVVLWLEHLPVTQEVAGPSLPPVASVEVPGLKLWSLL